ncbi:MAG: dihydrolipoamide acetyltransferase family protein [Candidatus Binatia bacterium]
MPIDVTMPKLSDTMEEGKVLRWLKHVGDRVSPGAVLAEVETDKAEMELEAYDEGVLAEVRVGEGESAPVGAVIAVLSTAGEALASPKAQSVPPPIVPAAPEAPVAPVAPAPAAERVRVSPLARRVASERGLDVGHIHGTGPGGRVVQRDVEAALATMAEPAAVAPVVPPRSVPPPSGPTSRRVELSKMRRTTARRMAEAKRDVPHFYVSSTIAMDEAVRLKAELAALGGAWTGVTYTHLLLRAAGLALRAVPEMNASGDGDAVVLHGAAHIGVATALDEGLIVPVVRDCDTTALAELVARARGVVERTRAGKFAPDDLLGGTFTISNLGMYPVSEFAAVVNPPQAAILAVGAVQNLPVVRDGAVVPGHVMTLTLSCDHRIVDGALAGRFLAELKRLLEHPVALLV